MKLNQQLDVTTLRPKPPNFIRFVTVKSQTLVRPNNLSEPESTNTVDLYSLSEAQNSVVYRYIKTSGHSFNPEEVAILHTEEHWFDERGVEEAIWERVEQPSLNKKRELHFLLSHAWDKARKDIPRRLSHDQSTGSQTWWSLEVVEWLNCMSSI